LHLLDLFKLGLWLFENNVVVSLHLSCIFVLRLGGSCLTTLDGRQTKLLYPFG